jgi:hypothetical protein
MFSGGNRFGTERGESDVFVNELTHPPRNRRHRKDGHGIRQREEACDHDLTFQSGPRTEESPTAMTGCALT